MSKTVWVALAIVGAIVALVAVLKVGAPTVGGTDDPVGDVLVGEGRGAPADTSIADIAAAEVRREDGNVVFEVKVAGTLPSKVPNGSLEFRWDISENAAATWLVSATINVEPNAAILSQRTNYGSSTIDDTLPGEIELDGDTLRVTLSIAEIEGFPKTFDWRLTTTLDAKSANTRSATATDTAPDSGAGQVRN